MQVQDDILFKIIPSKRNIQQNKIYKTLPQQAIQDIVQHFHHSQSTGHTCSNQMRQAILKAGIWWPTMEDDITVVTKSCQQCQQHHRFRD
ncbi:hypothetical protein CU097_005968, partial [Rhizopus azygosporus]